MLSYNPYYYKYISHHGIKGQEWGVKNGPPYPLDDAGIHINYDYKNKKNRVTDIEVADKKYKEEKKIANKKWKDKIKKNLLKAAVAVALIDPVLMLGGFNPVVFPTIGKLLITPIAAIKAKGLGGLLGKKAAKQSAHSLALNGVKAKPGASVVKNIKNALKVVGVAGAGGAAAANRVMNLTDTHIRDIYW